MKSFKRRIFAILMATIMCLATGTTAFAAETTSDTKGTCYNLEVSGDGIVSCTDENGNVVSDISPRSTISGYTQGTISRNNNLLVIYPDEASGIGGMGINIKASSSWNGNFTVSVGAKYSNGIATVVNQACISSNAENHFEDLMHRDPSYLVFTFGNIPSNTTINVQIWVYG